MRIAIIGLVLTAIVLGGALSCCTRHEGHGDSGMSDSDHSAAACTCEAGKAGGTTWCESCEVGYVAGSKTDCAGCYAAKNGGVPCAACSGN